MDQENQKLCIELLSSKTRRMKNNSVPSLQHANIVKIAIELWNQKDVRESIVQFRFDDEFFSIWEKWREIEGKVLVKVVQLEIPKQLKKEFLSVISSIGVEIKNWWEHHQDQTNISTLPNQFFWTQRGTIDKKRMAEMLVNDENIDIKTRYNLSCIYCLEDKIPELWNQIPEEQKSYFFSEENKEKFTEHQLKLFWTYHLFGEVSDLQHFVPWSMWLTFLPHKWALLNAIKGGNVVATKFFFDKLSDEERDSYFVGHVLIAALQRLKSKSNEEYYSSIFFFLMSKMREDQLATLLLKCPFAVLSCLLDWPYQPLFMDLAELIINLPSTRVYQLNDLLLSITRKIAAGWTDFDYLQLFCDFWHLSPVEYQIEAKEDEPTFSMVLHNLLEIREKEAIKLIFKHENASYNGNLILYEAMLSYLVLKKRWSSVTFLSVNYKMIKN